MSLLNLNKKNNYIKLFFISFLILSISSCGDSEDEENSGNLPPPQPTPVQPINPSPNPNPNPNQPPMNNTQGAELPIGTSYMFYEPLNGIGSLYTYPFPQMNFTKYYVRPGTSVRFTGTVEGGTYYIGGFGKEKCSSRSNALIPIFINGAYVDSISIFSTYQVTREGVLDIGSPSSTRLGTRFMCYYYNNFDIILERRN